jgi:DNA invertase Pin-like site-specific DNA recombinase
MTKRVGIYLRVSTHSQTTDNQLLELEKVAQLRGWQVVKVFEDHGISGSKGRDGRPAFDALCKAATRGEIDLIAAWSIDRLGRSLQHLVTFIVDMQALNVGLYLHQQGIDSSTAAGRAMLQMCGVFAEFERDMLKERIHAGLRRAKRQGKRFGRPTVLPSVESKVKQLRAEGVGMNKIARQLGVGVSTVQRISASA